MKGGENVTLTCTTKGSSQLSWMNDDYIGSHGEQLNLFLVNQTKTGRYNTSAVLIQRYHEDDEPVLVSELHIVLLPQFPSTTVTCLGIGSGNAASKTLTLAGIL